MDLDRIGVFGHSVGGGTAGNIAMKDNRVKAAVNLDGIQWGTMIDSTYHIPYLYVSADWPADHEDINSHVYINKGNSYFYESKLLNSGHPNFMDIPLMIPIRQIAGTGTIDPYEGNAIIAELVTKFFDRHLKQLPGADPLNIGNAYDLLEIKVYEGDSIK
jgi:predicted dienelactone hydrolase